MGRRRTIHHDLPPLVRPKGERLYYGRAWKPLGHRDDPMWLKRYAELHGTVIGNADAPTFQDAINAFKLSADYRALAPKTQREYDRQMKLLGKACGRTALVKFTPGDVKDMLKAKAAKHSATRMKALWSRIFTFARENHLTDVPNPAQGIRGAKSHRDVYVTDAELVAVVKARDDRALRKFLWLAYRTGADASIVLALKRTDLRDGAVHVQRTKTGRRTAITIEGPLKDVLDEANPVGSAYLVCDDHGQRFTLQTMRRRFWESRKLAGVTFQIRDLRAKGASDTDADNANKLLGHESEQTTALYRRRKVGERARPVMKEIKE